MPVNRRDLSALFAPASVAVVGATADPAKWGYALARQALRGVDRRPVHLVNRRGGSVLGHPCLPSLSALAEPVDLVLVAVPQPGFEAAVDEALAGGARAVVAITAGFAESGAAGAARQLALVARVRSAGALLLGPNCLGLVDNATELHLCTDEFPPGGVALLSQSGNLALELRRRLGRQSLGFSRFVSFGNQADVTLVDLVTDCAAHDPTIAIAIYAEDFGDGRAFARACARAGKPVVLLTAGATDASVRGARSHTGAMTSPSDVVRTAATQAGIHQAGTPRELVCLLAAVSQPRRGPGRRVVVVTDGGGHGNVAADVTQRAGLAVPAASPALRSRLRTVLWAASAVGNPVDLAGAGERDPLSYAAAVDAALADPATDAVLLTGYFGGYAASYHSGYAASYHSGYAASAASFASAELAAAEERAAGAIATAVARHGKPMAVQSIYPDSPAGDRLAAAGIPVFGAVEDAVLALSAVTGRRGPQRTIPPLPPAQPVLTELGYFDCRRVLAAAGVPFPPAAEVSTVDQVRAAAAGLPGPYVLKALHRGHKSEHGGVALNLPDTDALLVAYWAMRTRTQSPSYAVESMVPDTGGVELIVGVRWDRRFGPVAMVGLGGVRAELLGDVAYALAPLRPADAVRALRRLRGFALLRAADADLPAGAAVIAQVSAVAAAHPELAELECNPVLVTRSGAVALDARAVAAR